jgi:hypothetical protein
MKARKLTREIDYRNNDKKVTNNFRLEMKLVRNINKEKHSYSLD